MRAIAPMPPLSERARRVARMFGLAPALRCPGEVAAPSPRLPDGLWPAGAEIVLVCGASGAGKSSLLRRAMSMESRTWIDPSTLTLRGRCVVDCFEHDDLAETLELLSRFGLAEVWTYLRAPEALSEGQRWRLRLAMALERSRLDQDRSAPTLVCDEFCAALDRITAAVVSRALRKAIDGRSPVGALLATSHEDLASALRPDRIYRCDFGEIRRER